MRFCPFCAQETSDDAGRCVRCGRRLGARTAQHAPVNAAGNNHGPAQAPAPPGPRATRLGLGLGQGPGAPPEHDLGGGPTVLSGPADLDDDPSVSLPPGLLDEPRGAGDTLVLGGVRPTSGASRGGALDEETNLPPPAPGLEAPLPGVDPPTAPGRKAASGPEGRPRGQAPIARLPEEETAVRAPHVEDDSSSGMTGPMMRMDPSAETLPSPKASPAIPALPPPPGSRPSPVTPISMPGPTPARGTPLPAPPQSFSSAGSPTPIPFSSSSAITATGAGSTTSSLATGVVALPQIPAAPETRSILAAVIYLWPVSQGIWSRRREGARIRKNLVTVQQSLDGLLLQLGKVAFEENAASPPLLDEMTLLKQAEERRDRAIKQTTHLMEVRSAEEQRRAALEADQRQTIAALTRQAEGLDNELRQLADQRRQQLAEIARIDAELRRLQRAAEQADGRARKAQEAQAASQARAQADSARGQAEALLPQREGAAQQARTLDEPIQALTQQLGGVRSELGLRQKELLRQQEEKARLLQALDADIRLSQAERAAAEDEMQQRLMTVGTLVNLYRSTGARYQPLYQQVDEIRAQLAAYEATLARLQTESMSYDRQAVQKGLLVLGALGLLLGLLLAVFYLIWAVASRR